MFSFSPGPILFSVIVDIFKLPCSIIPIYPPLTGRGTGSRTMTSLCIKTTLKIQNFKIYLTCKKKGIDKT